MNRMVGLALLIVLGGTSFITSTSARIGTGPGAATFQCVLDRAQYSKLPASNGGRALWDCCLPLPVRPTERVHRLAMYSALPNS
jgi:hypothetical protein